MRRHNTWRVSWLPRSFYGIGQDGDPQHLSSPRKNLAAYRNIELQGFKPGRNLVVMHYFYAVALRKLVNNGHLAIGKAKGAFFELYPLLFGVDIHVVEHFGLANKFFYS